MQPNNGTSRHGDDRACGQPVTNPCWFPTLMHVGANDLMEKIPLPSMTVHTLRVDQQQEQHPTDQETSPTDTSDSSLSKREDGTRDERAWDPLYYNLMNDRALQKDVTRVVEAENHDPKFAKLLHSMMTAVDCSHVYVVVVIIIIYLAR